MVNKCVVNTCNTVKAGDGVTMHQLPADPVIRNVWFRALLDKTGQTVFREEDEICSKHFNAENFEDVDGIAVLKDDAVPFNFCPDDDEAPRAKRSKRSETVPSQCSVFSCTNVSNETLLTQPNLTYYPFPKSKVLLTSWKQFCNKTDDNFSQSFVCSDHFTANDFTNVTETSTGSDSPKVLKPNAVPSIYKSEIKCEELIEEGEEVITPQNVLQMDFTADDNNLSMPEDKICGIENCDYKTAGRNDVEYYPLKTAERNKRSSVWLYFNWIDDIKAECDLCKTILSYKGGATSNLKKHLERKHRGGELGEYRLTPPKTSNLAIISKPTEVERVPSKYGATVESPNRQPTSSSDPNPGRSASSISKVQIKISAYSHQEKYTSLILNMIIQDLQPFSIVEDRGFKAMWAGVEPAYTLPSKTTFSRILLPRKYEEAVVLAKERITEATDVTLTTDTWTSVATESYMTITAHYICNNWSMNSLLIGCVKFTERYTADNIKKKLIQVSSDWDITTKINVVVSDNAANITAAIKLTEWENLLCFAHTINLIVQNGLKAIESIQKKVKRIVEYFHGSPAATENLRSLQMQTEGTKTPLILVNDVVTRWHSTYFMFRRICDIQVPLEAALGVLHNPVESLSKDEWLILKECCAILKPFEQITNELSAEKTVSISKIIPMIEGLRRAVTKPTIEILSRIGLNLKQKMLTGITTRFSSYELNVILAKSTFLDPRFKTKGFVDSSVASLAKAGLNEELASLINSERIGQSENSEQLESNNENEEDLLWSHFDKNNDCVTSDRSSALIEMAQYCEEANIHRKNDSLKWWQTRQLIYPNLSKLAKKYLSIVATSVPSERIFSKTGLIISDRRSRLKAETAEKLIFLNANSDFLNLM